MIENNRKLLELPKQNSRASLTSPRASISPTVIYTAKDREMKRLTGARLESYLLDEKGLSVKDVKHVTRAIRTLQRVWGVTEPTTEAAYALKASMREAGRKANTIRLSLWAMKYWAQAAGGDLDLKTIKTPKPERRQAATADMIIDFGLVARIIGDSATLSSRDRCIVMVASISAARLGEIAELQLTSINHVKRTILLHDTKTGHDKTAYIPNGYYHLLTEYLDDRAAWLADNGKATDALWPSSRTGGALTEDGIYRVLDRIGRKYGLHPKPVPGERHAHLIRPHKMRHTGTSALRERMSAHEVMAITGHATSSMVDFYSHAREDAIRAKMDGFEFR